MDKAGKSPHLVAAMSDTLKALLHPFEKGLLPRTGRAFLLRAEIAPDLDEGWRDILVCEQGFKPAHDALQARGFTVTPRLGDGDFDLGLCLLTKHKHENLANLARAWAALRPGGLLVCAGGNDTGAASVERAFKAAAGVAVGNLSKYHCKVFWAERSAQIPAELAAWGEGGRLQRVPQTGCWSMPGLYNWNKVDDGSALLAAHLPGDIAGRVADLGAGWGYLSLHLAGMGAALTALDLYEAEWHGIEAARLNLAERAMAITPGFHWCDVAAGIPKATYDAVIMNPPFHVGKQIDTDLGRAFIESAAAGLVKNGRLFMVANRQLPYEAVLKARLRKTAMVAETGVYKVFACQA